MKSKTLLALAVAGTFACSAGAYAGGYSGAPVSSTSVEVQTPSSVNESAPWRAGEAHLAGWTAPQATHDVYGDALDREGPDATMYSVMVQPVVVTEYWLIGSETASAVGSSAAEGASGSVAFDSSMSVSNDDAVQSGVSPYDFVIYTTSADALVDSMGPATPYVTEYYLVPGSLAAFDESDAFIIAVAPTAEDMTLLDSLKEDFYILTPS